MQVGCAGRKLSSVEHEQPDWLEFAESRFGFGRVTVRDGYSLTWDYIRTEGKGACLLVDPVARMGRDTRAFSLTWDICA